LIFAIKDILEVGERGLLPTGAWRVKGRFAAAAHDWIKIATERHATGDYSL
jgi:hypothetical protein